MGDELKVGIIGVGSIAPCHARGFLKDGRAAEFTQSYYRGDIYDFVAELTVTT